MQTVLKRYHGGWAELYGHRRCQSATPWRILKCMAVMVNLPGEIEAQMTADAHAQGVPIANYLEHLIVEHYQEDADDLCTALNHLAIPNRLSLPVSCARTLVWRIEYDPRVEKELKAIDRAMQREVLDYMDRRIATEEDPRRFGKPLRYERRGLWRYRVQDYRII